MVLTMAHFIDKGLKGPDEPIFREGIGIVSVRKPAPRPEKPNPRLVLVQPSEGTGLIITGAVLPEICVKPAEPNSFEKPPDPPAGKTQA